MDGYLVDLYTDDYQRFAMTSLSLSDEDENSQLATAIQNKAATDKFAKNNFFISFIFLNREYFMNSAAKVDRFKDMRKYLVIF